jgi:hypothetical protein
MMTKRETKRRQTTNTRAQLWSKIMVTGLILIFLLLALGGFCLYHLKIAVADLNTTVAELNDAASQTDRMTSAFTEAEAFAFLQEETTRHREFIENERDFLIWLVAAVASIMMAVLGFIGIKQHRDVERLMENRVKQIIKDEITDYIGDDDRVGYLQANINQEERVKTAPILFIERRPPCEAMKAVYDQLSRNGHIKLVRRNIARFKRDYKRGQYDNYEVWIYEVAKTQKEEEAEGGFYKDVSDYCNAKEIFCILYSQQHLDDADKVQTSHTVAGNTATTVLERLYNHLNYWG